MVIKFLVFGYGRPRQVLAVLVLLDIPGSQPPLKKMAGFLLDDGKPLPKQMVKLGNQPQYKMVAKDFQGAGFTLFYGFLLSQLRSAPANNVAGWWII